MSDDMVEKARAETELADPDRAERILKTALTASAGNWDVVIREINAELRSAVQDAVRDCKAQKTRGGKMRNGGRSSTNHKTLLIDELENKEYRQAFVEAHAKDTIAFQIRQLRKANQWEQRDLAQKLGNPKLQPMISRYENPDYGKYSIATLLELANAFDVALVVHFAPFSELVDWYWKSNASTLAPRPYAKDKRLGMLRSNGG